MKKILIALFVVISYNCIAQNLPEPYIQNWKSVGAESISRNFSAVVYIQNEVNVADTLNNLIRSAKGRSLIIYFKSGKYLFNKTISLNDSVCLRAKSADSVTLIFDFPNANQHCIKISSAQDNKFIALKDDLKKGCFSLDKKILPNAKIGDWMEIVEDNGEWDTEPAEWASRSVGQIIRISSISKDSIYLTQAFRRTFQKKHNVSIRLVNMIKAVSLENFKIVRKVNPSITGVGYNIYFNYAANCSIKNIESELSQGSHILAAASAHINISGCYIHDAVHFDGVGTGGYGITFIQHSSDCLVQDNIFRNLRHSMVVKQGANGNVMGYNYSIDVKRTEFPSDAGADICLHGHFPFANLFEGNIVQNIQIDQAWGASGPYNTFLRNQAERYGIIISTGKFQSDSQVFIGNVVSGSNLIWGNYILSGTGHFEFANAVKGNMKPDMVNQIQDTSYYLSGKPLFWNISQQWPSITSIESTNYFTNPAKERYLENKPNITSFLKAKISDSFHCEDSKMYFKPEINSDKQNTLLEWHFGDGTISTEWNPKHSYSKSGSYMVVLKATDSEGNTDSVSKLVFIAPAVNASFKVEKTNDSSFKLVPITQDSFLNYHWYIQKDTILERNPVYINRGDTVLIVRLSVSNGICMDTQEKIIKIERKFSNIKNIKKSDKSFSYTFRNNNLVLFNESGDVSKVRLRLIDMQGKICFQRDVSGVNEQIPFPSELRKGIYVLQLSSKDRRIEEKIFIK